MSQGIRPSVSPTYKKCADENGTCNFSGTQSVAYVSADGTGNVHYRNPTNTVACNNSIFGDPAPGKVKQCLVSNIPKGITYNAGAPIGFAKCADENGNCNPTTNSQLVDILYGENSSFVYANTPSVLCSNTVFGDPAQNSVKSCYWRNSILPSTDESTATVTGFTATPITASANGSTTTPSTGSTTTPTTGSTTTTPPATTSTQTSGLMTGLLVGGIVFVIILIVIIILYMRRKQQLGK